MEKKELANIDSVPKTNLKHLRCANEAIHQIDTLQQENCRKIEGAEDLVYDMLERRRGL